MPAFRFIVVVLAVLVVAAAREAITESPLLITEVPKRLRPRRTRVHSPMCRSRINRPQHDIGCTVSAVPADPSRSPMHLSTLTVSTFARPLAGSGAPIPR